MSYQEYYTEVVRMINETELSLDEHQRMPERLLKLWIDRIREFCKNSYQEYLIGNRESYYMNEEEYDALFDKAGMDYTDELLNNLIDRELVEVGINEDGNMVYKATELGRKIAKN